MSEHEFVWRSDSMDCSICGDPHSGCEIVRAASTPEAAGRGDGWIDELVEALKMAVEQMDEDYLTAQRSYLPNPNADESEILNGYKEALDVARGALAKVPAPPSGEQNKQVPEQTISDECQWCAENQPEWSDDAKCWIHRRTSVDKRCLRKHLSPSGQGVEQLIAKKTAEIEATGFCQWRYACPYCLEGYIPVPSSVSEAMVHPDTPVGRVICEGRDQPTVFGPPAVSEAGQGVPVEGEKK